MSGSKYGFETKLRENAAPAPIDIYGDSCHHIHDACKKFTKIFNQYLKKLYQDIYNDFKWSENMRVKLQDICKCLNVMYRRPEMFVATIGCLFMMLLWTQYMCLMFLQYFISHFWVSQKKSCTS